MMRGLVPGLIVGLFLGSAGVVAGPPAVQQGLRASVPMVESGIRDAVSAVGHLMPATPPKAGGATNG